MNAATVLPHLPTGEVFNKNTFREAVHSIYPDCTEASINWMLVTLRKQGSLASAGTGKYYRIPQDAPAKKQYSYPHSPEYLDLEKEIGSGKIMLAGHDGHIAKKGQSAFMKVTMGGVLKEKYGDAYYSLGTDFFKGKSNIRVFSAATDEYERKDYYVTTADPLAYQAKYVDGKRFFMDFGSLSPENNNKLYTMVNSKVSMGSLGEGFMGMYYLIHSSYRVNMAPTELYDGMIFYYEVGAINPKY